MRALARTLAAAFGLTFLAAAAPALEIEGERRFEAASGAAQVLHLLSTTDTVIFAPVIEAFQRRNPDLAVVYTVASTQQVYSAMITGAPAGFDLVMSSAMDLQMKLANDGRAAPHRSPQTAALPDWARWRDRLFAFAQEPVVMIARPEAFPAGMPQTRAELIEALREAPVTFRGRIGTYDPRLSGAGYLFATQDVRQSEASWRLYEVMGALEPRLYATTGAMITGVLSGDLVLAVNVLGSYSDARLPPGGAVQVIEMRDFTHVLLRTALIPADAPEPARGARFLDYLLSQEGQSLIGTETGLPRLDEAELALSPNLRPIRLDAGLLVFVDPLIRQRFLNEWSAAMEQN